MKIVVASVWHILPQERISRGIVLYATNIESNNGIGHYNFSSNLNVSNLIIPVLLTLTTKRTTL
jgi:hypothetical protein